MYNIRKNFNYFVNSLGATRVVYGTYNSDMTNTEKNFSQNGGYWYIVSYFLVMACNKHKDTDLLYTLLDRAICATFVESKEGLAEWYYKEEKVGGAKNYSWSLAYRFCLFYGQILGIQPLGEKLIINPCINDRFR